MLISQNIEVMSDTDELVGLYYLYDEYKYKDNMLYKTPERQYIEINNDGTFTMYEYREPDIVYEGDTDSAINLSLERFLESTPDVNKEMVRSRNDVVYNYFLEGSYYIDKNNNVNQSFDNLTPLSDITVISGYLKQEYGEINLQFLDYVSFNVTNNQDGEIDFLIIVGESHHLTSFNKTSDSVLETERLLNIPFGEPSVTLFNKESFQRISMNEIPFEFMIKDNKLKSANQLQTEVNIAAQERENLYNLNESEHGTGIYAKKNFKSK
ncbi:hypothetical protein SAMN05192557_0962 [Aliicoccus persicus]|uniref:Uncharacterized protein n=2 Tax=Aliicoccus persicus TaxID=930138 RepID=A0A662Z2H2_9STAP|nr:hypothetical protein SAMN05192557_0962 [Aliicoccus persicus]